MVTPGTAFVKSSFASSRKTGKEEALPTLWGPPSSFSRACQWCRSSLSQYVAAEDALSAGNMSASSSAGPSSSSSSVISERADQHDMSFATVSGHTMQAYSAAHREGVTVHTECGRKAGSKSLPSPEGRSEYASSMLQSLRATASRPGLALLRLLSFSEASDPADPSDPPCLGDHKGLNSCI